MRRIAPLLSELDPEWIWDWDPVGVDAPSNGRIIGVKFTCPVDDGDGPHREGHSVAVLFSNPPDGGPAHPPDGDMIGDNDGKRWAREGSTFEDLSIEPSIDCTRSDAHCWHGRVRRGKVTG